MKLTRTFAALATTFATFSGASAQTVTPFEDVHPYQSQSIMRQADGTILVIPAVVSDYKLFQPGKTEPVVYEKSALIYEKRNPLPAIQVMGGTYAFFKGNYLATLSADGFFTYKGKMNFEPDMIGGSFFTKKGTAELVTVNSYGIYNECGYAANISMIGGNFYIDQNNILHTIRSVGKTSMTCEGMVGSFPDKKLDVLAAGGNFYLNRDGTIVGINSVNGAVSDPPYVPESRPAIMGGNYFIGQDNVLYTIDSEGKLFKTIALPSRPIAYGYSYLKFSDGSFALITANGGVHLEAIRVGAAGKAEYTTKVPAPLEINSTYVPNNYRRN